MPFFFWIAAQKVLSLCLWLCKEAVKCFNWNQHVSSGTSDLWCHSLLFIIKDRSQKYFESDLKKLYSDFYRHPKLVLRVLSNTVVSWIFFFFLINNNLMQLKHEQSLVFCICLPDREGKHFSVFVHRALNWELHLGKQLEEIQQAVKQERVELLFPSYSVCQEYTSEMSVLTFTNLEAFHNCTSWRLLNASVKSFHGHMSVL